MFPEIQEKLLQWVKEKKLKHKEQVIEGVENAPRALQMLMNGENNGKMIVRVLHEAPKL
jgi:NADPH-dependent curcumin reductase CurA